MRKYFLSLVAMAAMILLSGCNKNEDFYISENGDMVTFNIATPEMGTRAFSDGTTANKLIVAVYNDQNVHLPQLLKEVPINGSTTVQLPLVTGIKYNILFWAYPETGSPYSFNPNNGTVTVNYNGVTANNEKLDAFMGKELNYVVTGPASKTIYLTRPFAQLNVATKDYNDAVNSGIVIEKTSIKVEKAYNTLNLFNGEVSGEQTIELAQDLTPMENGQKLQGYENYSWLSMNYILVDGQTTVTATMGTDNQNVTRSWTFIPLQRNYRTNILGNILTTTTDFNVVIEEGFLGDLNEWDGKSVSEPKSENGIYQIYDASELAWLAAAVNGTLTTKSESIPADNFSGKTFSLMTDIDLQGNKWTPIGNSSSAFKGIFDGNNHTISNLVVEGGSSSNQGLFGYTTEGEIKNLIVNNAKVSGRLNVGVVAGTPYTSKYTNIKVTGHVEVNGMAYVGGVAGKNAYANWKDIKVDVDGTSYVNANSVENNEAYRTYVGGVVGFNGEGGHSFTNIYSNINVKGSTCDVGGMFGIAHYNNKFVNCVSEGDVEIYNGDTDLAEEIGGIAGVWHNENGTTVTFTNCSFTGTLKTNVEDVDLSDNTITGAAYSKTGTGTLIVDGGIYISGKFENTLELTAEKYIFDNVTINVSEGDAIKINNNIEIEVRGNINIKGAQNGIFINEGNTLVIKGNKNLSFIVEGVNGSGINGNVTLDGVNGIRAEGNGNHAFGIGANNATVRIINSTVDYACGGHIQPLFVNDDKYGKSEPEGAPAIGGAVIEIVGSTIKKVDGGSKAAAIGAQYWQSTEITIENSTILEAYGGNASAGIGGSRYRSDISAKNKQVTKIKIENSVVNATGGQAGAGIGAGYDTHCIANNTNAINDIIIVKSTINAKGGKYAAGIGTGFHSAALTGSIDASTINALPGDDRYKDTYTIAQSIGYGVIDPEREGANLNVTFKVNGNVIETPTKPIK